MTNTSRIEMLNSNDCFIFTFSLQVSLSTHWKTNNLSTTYWQTSGDGLSAQEFQLFIHCRLLTGIHIHTLRWINEDYHILSQIVWWVKWWTDPDFSALSSVHRYMRPHSDRQIKTPSHTDTSRLMQLMLNNSMCLFFELC